MIDLIMYAGIAILALFVWFVYCEVRTTQDRIWLIDQMHRSRDPISWRLYGQLRTVPRATHLWHRLTLRNPWTLYGARSKKLLTSLHMD